MKNYKEPRPRWGWLYASFGLMVALLYVEANLSLTSTQRTVALFGILGLVYFLTDRWIGSDLPFDPWS